jgi:alanyl-tRNA synthetase
MTDRLYYHDSFLYEFDAEVIETRAANAPDPRPAVVLDRTAFYPTSGGQVFDTGWITPAANPEQKVRIEEVTETDDGAILHFVTGAAPLQKGSWVHGMIDVDRRRDHMQQHSGQHVLSAAFVRLFEMPTVSFHMGADSCSIDLDTRNLTSAQVEAAEALANDVISQDRRVDIRFVTQEEAAGLGLRKLPPAEHEKLRLIEIQDFDLTACGGTHVTSTGQIGCILLRKTEKVRQGWRVEFVCGKRAVATARRDFGALTEAAGLCSGHIWELPQQVRKLLEESRAARKSRERLLEEIADLQAAQLLAATQESSSRKVIVRSYADRDLAFIKLLAQRLTRQSGAAVALLASTLAPSALVFAQSAGQPFDMGALMKEALQQLGGRGGGSKDMAQGGPANTDRIEVVLAELAAKVQR